MGEGMGFGGGGGGRMEIGRVGGVGVEERVYGDRLERIYYY